MEVVVAHQVENDDGQIVVHAQRDRRGIHNLQALVEHPHVGNVIELHGVGIRPWIVAVDAVDATVGALQHHARLDLDRPQRRRGVGREEGIARAGTEDDDPALLEVTGRPPPDVGLGDLMHLDGRLDTGRLPELLERVLQREGVHHGGLLSYVVGLGTIVALA